MSDIEKRPRYFNGQFLDEADFNAEQAYHLDRLRRQNRLLHTPGITEGLQVTANPGDTAAIVSPGSAIDGEGRQIVLAGPVNLPLNDLDSNTVLVLISYAEAASDPTPAGAGSEMRWHESPEVLVVAEPDAPGADSHIRLARLTVGVGGVLAGTVDTGVRQLVGGQPGSLSFRREDLNPSTWPALTPTASGGLDLSGTLNSRDIAADGAALDTHLAQTGNPHNVTAADIGAMVPADYDLGQREIAYVSFSHSNSNGAVASIDVGFQPKFVWVSGGAYASMNSYFLGGVTTGFAELDGTIDQHVQGVNAYRRSVAPYAQVYPRNTDGYIVYGYLYDGSLTPYRRETLGIKIDAVTATGLDLSFYRVTSGTAMTCYIRAYIACFG